jgi:hypothetical protein
LVVEEADVPLSADGQPYPGNYESTDAEGGVTAWTVNEDLTFTATGPDGTARSGTFSAGPDGPCIDYADDEEGPLCNTDGEVAEDGSWTGTGPDGQVSTIRRVNG